jgi:hypothetical protein
MFARTFDADDTIALDMRDPRARILAIVGTTSFYQASVGHRSMG